MTRLLGAHMSIAGGLHNALLHGQRVGCTAIQLFSKNNNQWRAKPISQEEIELFQETANKTKVFPRMIHCAYLINLASPVADMWQKSFAGMQDEVTRCGQLEVPYLVLHPGSHTGSGLADGIARIADSINRIHQKQESKLPMILLECMAGQGFTIGAKFEELAEIIEQVKEQTRIGICIDTCHLFAAGYDIRTREGFEKTLTEFDRIIGLERIKAFHLNDSKKDLGSRVDRHEHIGKGFIGVEAFRYLLNDARFQNHPMVLETPKSEDDEYDLMNLAALRSVVQESQSIKK